jgi:HTH-type transcriptional regulator/antitoxin HipB
MIVSHSSEIGSALRARRAELRITQDELAETIGVHRRVIGELERGKGSVRLEIALAAIRAVGLDVDLRARGRWES